MHYFDSYMDVVINTLHTTSHRFFKKLQRPKGHLQIISTTVRGETLHLSQDVNHMDSKCCSDMPNNS